MEVVTFAARLPVPWMHPIKARKVGMAINQMGGLMGIYPDQRGMVMVFATQAHAEKGRAKLASMRVPVGKYMMRGTFDMEKSELHITEPVDGWTEEEKAEIERIKEETIKKELEGCGQG